VIGEDNDHENIECGPKRYTKKPNIATFMMQRSRRTVLTLVSLTQPIALSVLSGTL
jgi:hypothetical protein